MKLAVLKVHHEEMAVEAIQLKLQQYVVAKVVQYMQTLCMLNL